MDTKYLLALNFSLLEDFQLYPYPQFFLETLMFLFLIGFQRIENKNKDDMNYRFN